VSAAARIAAIAAAAAFAGGPAGAHPLDEVIQAAYLTLAPGEVQLDLEIQPGVLVAGSIARDIDANGDGKISEAEARAYGERVLRASTLTVDGAPAALRLLKVAAPAYANLVQGDIVHVQAVARRKDRAGTGALAYLNRYAPVKSQYQANVFLSMGGGWTYAVASQAHGPDGRRLDVAYRVARGT
jgi:hypothetical protein